MTTIRNPRPSLVIELASVRRDRQGRFRPRAQSGDVHAAQDALARAARRLERLQILIRLETFHLQLLQAPQDSQGVQR